MASQLIWEALDKRVRSEEEIEDTLGLPLLARLPEPPKEISAANRLVMLEEPTGVHAEAVRRLRTNVEFAMLEGDAQTIMITSAVQREGKSTTVANLALALARSGRKVALIDLDLRQPMVDQFFALEGLPGATDVALGRATLDEVLVEVSVPERASVTHIAAAAKPLPLVDGKLSVIPSGQLPASPGEFVGTVAMGKLLADLRRTFDIVLIDAPPMCIVGDAMTLSSKIDAFIVVARVGTLERRTLADLQREIAASPARALGVVVTGVDPTDAYGAGSYYHKPAERPTSRSQAERRPAEANSGRASARPR